MGAEAGGCLWARVGGRERASSYARRRPGRSAAAACSTAAACRWQLRRPSAASRQAACLGCTARASASCARARRETKGRRSPRACLASTASWSACAGGACAPRRRARRAPPRASPSSPSAAAATLAFAATLPLPEATPSTSLFDRSTPCYE